MGVTIEMLGAADGRAPWTSSLRRVPRSRGVFVRGCINIVLPAESGIMLPSQAVQPLGWDDVVFVLVSLGHYDIRRVVVGRRRVKSSN